MAAQIIKIQEGVLLDGIVFDLSRSTCAIEGRVRDNTGEPAVGVKIGLMSIHDYGQWVLPMSKDYKSPVTDELGNYRFENLPPGDWHVYAWHEDIKQKAKPQPVTLRSGKITKQDLRIDGVLKEKKLVEAGKI